MTVNNPLTSAPSAARSLDLDPRPPGDSYTVEVHHVTKRYGDNTVVDDLSFSVPPGVRDRSTGQQLRSPAQLRDPEWLAGRYAAGASAPVIAAELGIPEITVYKAMHRHGIERDGPWVRRDTTRLERPPDHQLAAVWAEHQPLRAVAQHFSVAHTTAAVWLARAGLFVKDTPALSRKQLEQAIADRLSLREIAARHRVGQQTVVVELIRHDLVVLHRLRGLDAIRR